MKVLVKEPHTSNYPNPISFSKGDVLKLGRFDTEFSGWVRVFTSDGNEGWAPIDYVDTVNSRNTGVAKCDYNAFELNTQSNEILTVLLELNEWFLAINSHGLKGWVPIQTVVNLP